MNFGEFWGRCCVIWEGVKSALDSCFLGTQVFLVYLVYLVSLVYGLSSFSGFSGFFGFSG